MTSELTVAVVGAGIIGRNHVAALLRIPQLRIVAVVDPVTTAATELASTVPSAPLCFAGLDEALAATKPQIVVICTPSGRHVAQALEALGAGAHVVIEKPLDVSVAHARPLLAAARSAPGRLISVISQHRFDPATMAVSEAIRAGRLGRLTSAVATVPWWRGQDYYDSAGWRGTIALDGGGALMNQGVHTLDLLLHFLGRPTSVFAYTDRLAHSKIEVEDVLVALLRFESGALATLHATTAAYPGTAVRLQVHGSHGTAVLHDDQLEYVRFAPPPADAASAAPPAVSSSSSPSVLAVPPAVSSFSSSASAAPPAVSSSSPSASAAPSPSAPTSVPPAASSSSPAAFAAAAAVRPSTPSAGPGRAVGPVASGRPNAEPFGAPAGAAAGGLPGAEPFGAPKPADNFVVGHLRQYADIVDAIRTGRPPAVGVEDGFLALAVVEAIYESAKSGQPVAMDGNYR